MLTIDDIYVRYVFNEVRMQVAKTGAYLGKWGGKAWAFEQLREDKADQEPLPDLIYLLKMGKSLGHGSFGAIFRCEISAYDGNKNLVIKLPQSLIDLDGFKITDKLAINAVGKPHYLRMKLIKSLRKAQNEFYAEVKNFEKIYETVYQVEHFGGARRAINADLQTMRSELRVLDLAVGRKYIHQILHFDPDIPAIISERCDGSLKQLRTRRPRMFLCTPELSTTWEKIGFELGSAIDYIGSRGMVHVDIKPANVFYVWQNRQPVVKLGDFGLCHPKEGPVFYGAANWQNIPCGTPKYSPRDWPHVDKFEKYGRTVDAEVLSHAQFAICMLHILYSPEATDWPLGCIEDSVDKASESEWGKHLFADNSMITTLVELLFEWMDLEQGESLVLLRRFVAIAETYV